MVVSDGTGEQLRLDGDEDHLVGFRGPTVCKIVGITYRQLDYWARTGLVVPSVRDAKGSGSQRLYSFDDLVELRVMKRLLDTGVSLQRVRQAVEELRRRGRTPGDVTLLSDGTTVYALDDNAQVIDLLARGQGVFAIALGPVVNELRGEVAQFPFEAVARETVAAPEVEQASASS
ncbi:MAG: MerR family transcriptional regulator [Nitriliruptorales bacterium]